LRSQSAFVPGTHQTSTAAAKAKKPLCSIFYYLQRLSWQGSDIPSLQSFKTPPAPPYWAAAAVGLSPALLRFFLFVILFFQLVKSGKAFIL